MKLPTAVYVGKTEIPVSYVESLERDGMEVYGLYTGLPLAIHIRNGIEMTPGQTLSTLVHETAHAYMDNWAVMGDRDIREFDEESLVLLMESVFMHMMQDNPELATAMSEYVDSL